MKEGMKFARPEREFFYRFDIRSCNLDKPLLRTWKSSVKSSKSQL